MINAYRNKFIKQHLELYGEELFLDSSSKKPGGEFSELSKTDLLNNLHSKIDIELVPKKGTVLDKVVFGSGDPNADLLFVGESPSIRELENNKPLIWCVDEKYEGKGSVESKWVESDYGAMRPARGSFNYGYVAPVEVEA